MLMAPNNRASLVIRGGVTCALLGSLVGGCGVALISGVRGSFGLAALTITPIAALFAAITAAPFGFAVGPGGVWWLAGRAERVSERRLYFESAGGGAALGATYPLTWRFSDGVLSKILWPHCQFRSEPELFVESSLLAKFESLWSPCRKKAEHEIRGTES
jgi:hypothetical protein